MSSANILIQRLIATASVQAEQIAVLSNRIAKLESTQGSQTAASPAPTTAPQSFSLDDLSPLEREALRGPPGRDGADGADGKDGKDGAVGPKGEPGVPGAAGKNGKDGKDGKEGKAGKVGKPGKNGAFAVESLSLKDIQALKKKLGI